MMLSQLVHYMPGREVYQLFIVQEIAVEHLCVLTLGASCADRQIIAKVVLGNGKFYHFS